MEGVQTYLMTDCALVDLFVLSADRAFLGALTWPTLERAVSVWDRVDGEHIARFFNDSFFGCLLRG